MDALSPVEQVMPRDDFDLQYLRRNIEDLEDLLALEDDEDVQRELTSRIWLFRLAASEYLSRNA